MILTTTNAIENRRITTYKGIVAGETIMGAHIGKDILAGLTDIFGGRSGTYERTLAEARETALAEMSARAESLGANAIIGIDLDYETMEGMLMVNASGTAVVVE